MADGPEGGAAFWLTTEDRVRLRIGVWPGGQNGTVLLFPGRSEYVEKYGRAARDLLQRGFSLLVIDWRGQGLADRLIDDPDVGHVARFTDYQHDVAAVMDALPGLDLPGPHHLLSHSMGGAIALRALLNGLPVRAAVFSAPMWNIHMSPLMRPAARALSFVSRPLGFGASFAPGTNGANTYVAATSFKDNALTSDADMYAYMKEQAAAHPELALGGPSLAWVHEAMRETLDLAARPSPPVPALTFLGAEESIVSPDAIRERMARWPGGSLVEVPGARHEVMMETPEIRSRIFDQTCAFFAKAPARGSGLSASA